jgi:hypothetical protein
VGAWENLRPQGWAHRPALRDGGLALLVVATLALVVTVLTGGDAPTSTLVTVPSTTPAPLLSPDDPLVESMPPASTPTPSAAPAGTPSPRPSPSVLPSASPASRSASPRPTPRTTAASPEGTYPGPGLRLDVTVRPAGTLVGQTTVRVRDTDGTWNGGFIAYGDGQRQEFGRTAPRCSGTSAPGDATPSDVTRTFRHTYDASGSYDVVVYVRTERFCSQAPVEDGTRTVRVRITGPSSSPTPSSEPSPDPTPAETSAPRPR